MKLVKNFGFVILSVVVILLFVFVLQQYVVEGASNRTAHVHCPNKTDEIILINGKGLCSTKKVSAPSGLKLFGDSTGFVCGIKATNGSCPTNYNPVYYNKNYCFSLKPSLKEQIKCPNGYSLKLFKGAQYCTAKPLCPKGTLSKDNTICNY